MNISEAAKAAGVSPKMIRHYEQIGLVAAAARSEAGYRQFSAGEVSVLRFIRQARRLDFSVPQIAALLSLWRDPRRDNKQVKELAVKHLAELQAKLHEIAALTLELDR